MDLFILLQFTQWHRRQCAEKVDYIAFIDDDFEYQVNVSQI